MEDGNRLRQMRRNGARLLHRLFFRAQRSQPEHEQNTDPEKSTLNEIMLAANPTVCVQAHGELTCQNNRLTDEDRRNHSSADRSHEPTQ